MNAGELRHVVEIQDYAVAQDSSGDDVKTWHSGSSAFATVHASIKQLRGRELLAAQTKFAEAQVEIGIRYLAGVNARMRVKHLETGLYFNILNVDDVELRHREMLLLCETGVSDDA